MNKNIVHKSKYSFKRRLRLGRLERQKVSPPKSAGCLKKREAGRQEEMTFLSGWHMCVKARDKCATSFT